MSLCLSWYWVPLIPKPFQRAASQLAFHPHEHSALTFRQCAQSCPSLPPTSRLRLWWFSAIYVSLIYQRWHLHVVFLFVYCLGKQFEKG